MGEWKEISIGQLAKGIRGVSYKPHQLKDDVSDGSFYLLRSNNIKNAKIAFSNIQIVDKCCVKESQKIKAGDIIVCMSNGSRQLVGKSALTEKLEGDYCVGAFCSSFIVKDGTNSNFVFQVLQSDKFKQSIDVILSGSAINNLQNKQIEEIKLFLPALPEEQTRIAENLSTADEAIAHTEALIAKYQRIKTGLMQDLLTKGIDEKGNIRSKETHKFVLKNGIEVPEEWEVVPLSYFIKKLESGVSVNSNDKPAGSGQYGVLKTSSLSGCVFAPIQNKTVDDIEIKRLKCPVRKGSIIISRMNTPDLVGENALVENEFENLFLPDRLWQAVFQNIEELNIFWLSKLLSSIKYRQKISFQATGTSGTMKNITKNDFLQIYIPKPDINEQNNIAKILESVNINETKLNNNLQKLQSLKSGLMQDLLSGKVRVNMDNKN